MAFKHPFSANAIKSRFPRAICGISSLLLTAAGFTTSAHAQNTSNSVSLTLSGKKVTYSLNSNWVAFKVKSSGTTATTIKGLSSQAALTKNSNAVLAGSDVAALRVDASASAASQNQLSGRLASASSIERKLRVFGSSSSPIIETTDALVHFAAGVSDADKKKALKKQGAILVGAVGKWAPGTYRVRVSSPNAYATNVANGLLKAGVANWAHPDLALRMEHFEVKSSSVKSFATTNDPLFSSQWYLSNNGVGGTLDADVSATKAWDVTRGAGVKLAIHDDGVDIDHEDLKDRYLTGKGFGDESDDPRPRIDSNKHGSAVAGLAIASGDNAIGISGVAPQASLIVVRTPYDRAVLFSMVADSLVWATDQGADIISCSWGFPDLDNTPIPDTFSQALDYVTTKGRGGKGTVILYSAGNDTVNSNNGLNYDPRVITISSTTRFDKIADYSNFGPGIDVAAPGTNTITTDRTGAAGYAGGNYTDFSGTSAACPVAAGVTALVLAANPSLSNQQVYNILTSTADKIDPTGGNYDNSGHSDYYGYGRLNAFKAVKAAVDLLGAQVTITTPADGAKFDRGELTTAEGTGSDLAKSVNVGLVKTDINGKRTAYYNFTAGEWVTIPASNKTVGMYAAEFDDDADTWQADLPELGGGYYEFLAQGFTEAGTSGKVVSSKFSVDLIDVSVTTPTINGEYQAGDVSGNLPTAEGTTDADAASVGVGLIKKNASGQSVYQWDFNAADQTANNWVAINSSTQLTPATLETPVDDDAAWSLDLPTVLQTGKYELRVQAFDAASTPGEMKVVPFSLVGSEDGTPVNVSLTPLKAKAKTGKVIAFKGTYKHTDDYSKLTELHFRARVSEDSSSPLVQIRYDVVNNVVSIYNQTTGRWLNGYKPGTNVIVESDVAALNIRNCKFTLPKGKKATKTASVSFTFAFTPRVTGFYQTAIASASKAVSAANNWSSQGTLTVTAGKSSNKGSALSMEADGPSIPQS